MTKANMKELEERLGRAWADGRLLVCESDVERRRFDRYARTGKLVRPMPGCYAGAEQWREANCLKRHAALARALAVRNPEITFCGVTASALLGYSPSFGLLNSLHTVGPRGTGRPRSSRVQHHTSQYFERIVVDGVGVTPPERTVFDCMRTLPIAEGLAIADAACRKHGWSPRYLREVVESLSACGGYRGVRRARMVAAHVDPRSENGGESIARANMLLAGFECPELQVEIENPLDPFGKPSRVDFAWFGKDGTMIAGELDGRQKYENEAFMSGKDTLDVLLDERLRESRVSARGFKVVRFTFSQANDRAELARILDVYGVPRRKSSKLRPTALLQSVDMGYARYLDMRDFQVIVRQCRWLDATRVPV